jgi:hypothetical protein
MKFNRPSLVRKNELLVFVFSIIIVICLLVVERAVGIGWDYHTDSVTYATKSDDISSAIYTDMLMIINNGYYVLSSFLGMSVIGITAMNMILFSYTNVMIYRVHRDSSRFLFKGKTVWILCLFILLCNPYRVHLGTTMLKDSVIIMLLVYAFTNGLYSRLVLMPVLVLFRMASPLYFLILLKRNYTLAGGACILLIWAILGDVVTMLILDFNSNEMVFRDFDRVPTFQDFGLAGAVARAFVWPFLALSGTFSLISPAPAFAIISIGIFGGLAYMILMTGKFRVSLSVYAVMMVFAILVTGFGTYLRYVYPILVLMPLMAIQAAGAIKQADISNL